MGLMERFSNWRYKRSKHYELGSSILNGTWDLGDDNILTSSDVYKLMTDVSNMIACSTWVVEKQDGTDILDSQALKTLNRPNGYLSGFEFKKLLVHVYFINGEVFTVKDNNQLHIIKGIQPEITDQAVKVFKFNGETLYNNEVAQIKNIGLSHNSGMGLVELAKDTVEGVMNAEKSITDKYKKGGLLAYLLKLETHLSPKNTQQTEMVEMILNRLSEIPDEGKTIMIPLSKGYEVEGFESPVDDEKILKYLSVAKPELTKFLGFDPDAYNTLLKNDLEKAAIYLKAFICDPIIQNICDHYSFLFFGEDTTKKISMKVDMKKYLTMSAKISNISNLIRSMAYTPDDGREDLGIERLNTPESTQLYASKDLVGLDELADLNKSKMKEGENTG